ncbi:MAG: hypothetical protein EOP04_28585 [Proteobacteria bacterium]|nr:MAG: hypothetical protein EOP04_28585 [Pseudomonadota bacterium]
MPTNTDKAPTSGVDTFDFRSTRKHPHVIQHLRQGANKLDIDMAEFARLAVEAAYQRVKRGLPIEGEVDWASADADSFRAPYLRGIPCGPWKEAVQTEETYTINSELAEEFEAMDGDVFIRTEGESMEGVGIHEDFVVLIRPYKNRPVKRHDVVLIQAFTSEEGDAAVATLKKFEKMQGNIPALRDGDDEPYALPEGVQRVEIIGRAIGIIGTL